MYSVAASLCEAWDCGNIFCDASHSEAATEDAATVAGPAPGISFPGRDNVLPLPVGHDVPPGGFAPALGSCPGRQSPFRLQPVRRIIGDRRRTPPRSDTGRAACR